MTERLALLAWLIACGAPAGEPNALYDRRETWAESLTATRRKVAQLQAQNLKLPADGTDWAAVWEDLYRRFWTDWPETDWLLQDNPIRTPTDDFDARREIGWYFESRRDASAEQQFIRSVIDKLG